MLKTEEQQQRSSTPSSSAALAADGEQKVKRQSFMPDLSYASSSLGAEALTLPIGIPLGGFFNDFYLKKLIEIFKKNI
jgi:hypothetical protein